MSGGYWNFEDRGLDSVTPEQLHAILEVLPRMFHIVDWSLSNDQPYGRSEAKQLFKEVKELGNQLFNRRG